MKKRGIIIAVCLSVMMCLGACSNKKEKETTTKESSTKGEVQTTVEQTEINTTETKNETEKSTVDETQEKTEKSTNEPYSADAFDGTYTDERDSNTIIEITTNDEVTTVKISMAVSVTESKEWTFSGKFDEDGTLKYTNCVKNTVNYTDETTSTATEEYRDGKGSVTIADDVLTWNDEEEGTSPEGAYKKL
ncbi:hypothetical protein [Eubacterium sp.]|uniref:hypothetical protein n=1 Tax=Eubacterium sp. TaxID=142586 RepID=UPI0025CC7AA8|nr:hypothetical protein [Eubacterium sp.]MCR5629632.1 hypothetical protein [Eubacterium sp.]